MPHETIRFEDFELDSRSFELRQNGQPVKLEPIPLQLLLLLAENRDRLVSREEILHAIWGEDVFIDAANSINTAVRKARQALKDDPDNPRFLRTVAGKGYRFTGEITPAALPCPPEVSVPVPPEPTRQATQSSRGAFKWAVWMAVPLVVAVIAGSSLYLHPTPRLTEKDSVVLAGVTNSTGDPVFDDTLREGLAIQLAQSPFLNILSEQKLHSVLKEMTRSPDQPLTPGVAQEACERTGSKAYITGSVAYLGGHYVIALDAINCATGDALAREQVEAGDKHQVLAALGKSAEKLRKELGESLSSIEKFDVPLVQATTSSLEALKAYSLGLANYAKGDVTGAIPLFRQAIDLDSDFAMAYAHVGRAHQMLGQDKLMDEALRKAFTLRQRASEREKFDISAAYYQFITHQTEETIQICELWRRTYPRDFTPHRILGFENAVLGNYEQSAEEFKTAKELDPSQAIPYGGLMLAQMDLGRLSDAQATYEEARARKLDAGELLRIRYVLAFLQHDTETMSQTLEALGRQPGFERIALEQQWCTDAYFGRLRKAREISRRIHDLAAREKDQDELAEIEAHQALLEVLFGNSADARVHANASLRFGEEQPAMALALLGDTSRTRRLVDKMSSHAAPHGDINKLRLPELQAAIELKNGNPARAVELLAPLTTYEAGWDDGYMAAYLRGESYLAEHFGPQAAAEFHKIVDHPGVVVNNLIGPLAHLGLARACAMQGQNANAKAAYQDFITLWKDGDPEIPVLIAAKLEYAHLR